jgi:hypothetical protein
VFIVLSETLTARNTQLYRFFLRSTRALAHPPCLLGILPTGLVGAMLGNLAQAGLKDSNVIYQSKFVKICEKWYLVLATDAGVQVCAVFILLSTNIMYVIYLYGLRSSLVFNFLSQRLTVPGPLPAQIWDALGNNILFNFVFPTGLKVREENYRALASWELLRESPNVHLL